MLFWNVFVDAFIGQYPDILAAIFINAIDSIAAQAVLITSLILQEALLSRFFLLKINPVSIGPSPENAMRIFQYGGIMVRFRKSRMKDKIINIIKILIKPF